jgi:hypothetical protein
MSNLQENKLKKQEFVYVYSFIYDNEKVKKFIKTCNNEKNILDLLFGNDSDKKKCIIE